MHPKAKSLGQGALTVALCATLVNAFAGGDAKRGEYLAKAAGCVGCHTEEKKDAVPFAGGRALKTPFGTFYGPNITSHPQAGIGRWTEADFMRAMREGERPDGRNYFPAFPYPSFTKITDRDLRDLWAYLRALPPSARANQEHDLWFIFGWRFLVTFWKWFFFTPGPFVNIPGLTDIANRGAYLVQALGHCGECHTPREFSRRAQEQPLPGRRQGTRGQGHPESHAYGTQEAERQGPGRFPHDRTHPGRRRPRRGDGRSDPQHHQPAYTR